MSEAEFKRVGAAALASAHLLLPRWMGGKRNGDEWTGGRKSEGGPGDSWSVNLTNGVWSHFASGGGHKGHDLIGLYAALFDKSQGDAKKAIEAELGLLPADHGALPVIQPKRRESKAERIPEDAPPIRPHKTFGPATAEYRYGQAFVITRYDHAGGKTFSQWTWRNGGWIAKGYGDGQPLYNAHELAQSPEAPVLLVEGEKCVEAAKPVLSAWVVTTWAGGTAGWKKADWSVLEHRDVVIWPDADDPGREAAAQISAHLSSSASRVRIVNPNGAAPGWDIADAITQDGWSAAQLGLWIREHIKQIAAEPAPQEPARNTPPAVLDDIPSAPLSYVQIGLECDHKLAPYPTLANASKILQLYTGFKGNIWFDEFRGRVYHTVHQDQPKPWTDRDTRRVTVAIQQSLKLPKFHINLVRDAVVHAAECATRNSLTDYLDSLEWDRTARLDTWLSDCAGVEANEYTQAVARNWLIGMVARAYQPGCKMDHMPVLEGVSGLKKSMFLAVLGGEWFRALNMVFGDRDFLQSLRGAWLIEIPDMVGFTRADHTKVIATITTSTDSYRAPYSHTPEDVPRTCVFAATSETDDYLSDPRGRRRYWPIRCVDIDIDSLRSQRDQLFAEAVQCFRNGASWYEMPNQATEEQLDRTKADEFAQEILEQAEHIWGARHGVNPQRITAKLILALVFNLTADRIDDAQCRRVTNVLRANGWHRKRDKTFGFQWLKREPGADDR